MKKKRVLFFFIILPIGIFYSCIKTKDMSHSSDSIKDSIELRIYSDSVTKNNYTTFMVFFTIKNQGTTPVKIVKRLSIGYEDSFTREVYLLVTTKGVDKNIAKGAVLYNRENATENDFEWLQPGESFKTDFILSEWYELPEKPFEIQAVYDPTESLKLDDSLAKNKYYSNKIVITNK